MKRLTIRLLFGTTLLGLAIAAFPQVGFAQNATYLESGIRLYKGDTLSSPNGYDFALQTDGNLVIYNRTPGTTPHIIWAANTYGSGADFLGNYSPRSCHVLSGPFG